MTDSHSSEREHKQKQSLPTIYCKSQVGVSISKVQKANIKREGWSKPRGRGEVLSHRGAIVLLLCTDKCASHCFPLISVQATGAWRPEETGYSQPLLPDPFSALLLFHFYQWLYSDPPWCVVTANRRHSRQWADCFFWTRWQISDLLLSDIMK